MLAICGLLVGLAVLPSPAFADAVAWTPKTVLASFFARSERVTYTRHVLSASDRAAIKESLGYAPARETYTVYVGLSGTHVDGYAILDDEKGEHLPITFAVLFDPRGVVRRLEVMVYREAYGHEIQAASFRQQFIGKTHRDPIRAGKDIVALSGATISSRSMARGVKRAALLLDKLVLSVGARAAPSR